MSLSRITKRLGTWLVVGSVVLGTVVSVGCLARPVGQQPPTTKVNFTSSVSQQDVDKVDLLFMIDNSASMGDKQDILADAVPNLLVGLLKPKCVDPNGAQVGGKTADPNGNKGNNFNCPAGSEPEFRPVTDMHIGIISSSLGTFGGDVCPDVGATNDKGHLLNLVQRSPSASLAEAAPSNLLSWFPSNEENKDAKRHPTPPTAAITDLTALQADFRKLVTGVEQNGCGLEAQLESVYRFLIQPDPWVEVKLDAAGQADLGGPKDLDTVLLQQRADFLREDSLVAIILLTDEEDSAVDPLSVGGQGWAFAANKFPNSKTIREVNGKPVPGTTAARGTSACKQNPGSPDCTSCGFVPPGGCDPADSACKKIQADPECQKNGGYLGPAEDDLNSRFSHQLMKRNYGVDPQFPVRRYVDGLTKFRVPDRTTEHPQKLKDPKDPSKGRDIEGYVGTPKCTNPLFAKKLPRQPGEETCLLQRSTRGPDLIFFAVVGGVPNKLLHFDPSDSDKSRITSDDWNAILGKDPVNYNYDGIDPHMIESKEPRPALAALFPASATRGDNGADPNHGREWDNGGGDLQYACTFDLPTPRKCSTEPSCQCGEATMNPPLCGPTLGEQLRAKAYPTVREFMVVRALGDQGVIASLCPITLAGDKLGSTYGYNPAVKTIIDRLKNRLTTQCLPQKLTKSSEAADKDQVPCLVLAQLGQVTDSCEAENVRLPRPPPEILAKFLEQKKVESGDLKDGGIDLTKRPVCVLPQLVAAAGESCKDAADKGWCYVENAAGKNPAGKTCSQALIFSSSTSALAGADFSLQCIQQFSADAGTK